MNAVDVERFCQAQKEDLLELRKRITPDVTTTCSTNSSSTSRLDLLPNDIRKLYNEVLPHVRAVHLLNLELKQVNARLLKQNRMIKFDKIHDSLYNAFEPYVDDASTPKPFVAWQQEMEQYIRQQEKKTDAKSIINCFVEPLLFTMANLCRSKKQLSFSTCYHRVTVHVTITEVITDENRVTYCFTSDVHIEELETKGALYIEQKRTAAEFVRDIIWSYLRQEILPYTLT
ncbi:PREDICTED: uncharacterized protein LOC106805600 [Priapulus caudatus]|uniref:Uncharacterized protein LOC106805600 n=1 Tax=Priapulus caudatus TaxID=37621 RepID=A0ABM1DS29_PRICU|nr:PREDICTED: uncharacterized protein LOC106805600 [Priapulus caudatus]